MCRNMGSFCFIKRRKQNAVNSDVIYKSVLQQIICKSQSKWMYNSAFILFGMAQSGICSIFFCPSSPTKSGRKPQKRYLTSDEDDDDSLHYQPSPSVRRKLSHSFANENFSRYGKLWYSWKKNGMMILLRLTVFHEKNDLYLDTFHKQVSLL